jgi:hypothetical protein
LLTTRGHLLEEGGRLDALLGRALIQTITAALVPVLVAEGRPTLPAPPGRRAGRRPLLAHLFHPIDLLVQISSLFLGRHLEEFLELFPENFPAVAKDFLPLFRAQRLHLRPQFLPAFTAFLFGQLASIFSG